MLNVLRFGAFVCLLVQIAVAQTVGPAPGGSGSGTVTSVATTSPITGGTITGTGTIACATCVVSGGALGTPSSGTATNLTGLPLTTGVTGLLPAANANLSILDGSANFCADAGSNDTYACNLSPAIAAYVTGGHYRFKANTINTGAATINFNSVGAKTIVKVAGGITTALADADIRAGQYVDVVYDGTNMQLQSTLGNASSGGGATISSTTNLIAGDGGGNGIAAPIATNADTSLNLTKALTWASASTPTYNSGGTTTCDWSASNACLITAASGNSNLALTNPHGSGLYLIKFVQDSTDRTLTYPGSLTGCPAVATGSGIITELLIEYDGTSAYKCISSSIPNAAWHGLSCLEGTALAGLAAYDQLYCDSTAHRFKMNNNNGGAVQVVGSGVDINTSDQVTATHLAAALPVNQGGTGTQSTLTGLMRGSASAMTAAELSGDVTTSGSNAATIAANAVGSSKMAVVNTRRVCDIPIGDTSGSALTNGQLGPQKRVCYIPYAATVVEITVAADGGTPNIIVGKNTAGTQVNLLSSALATAASGGIACSNTGGTTGIDGATTCSSTLQNTSISAGAYLELVSGTAGGTAKFMTVHVVYVVN